MFKRLSIFLILSSMLGFVSWGNGGCGSGSPANLGGFPIVGSGYTLREIDNLESCFGPIPAYLEISNQFSDAPDQLVVSIANTFKSGITQIPATLEKTGYISFEGTIENKAVSCAGQAIIEDKNKSDITLPLSCSVDSVPCQVTFDNGYEPAEFPVCEVGISDEAAASSLLQSYDSSPLAPEVISALKNGCIFSEKIYETDFLKAFLCSIGVDPELSSSAIIRKDIDNLESIDLDNLIDSCENEIGNLRSY